MRDAYAWQAGAARSFSPPAGRRCPAGRMRGETRRARMRGEAPRQAASGVVLMVLMGWPLASPWALAVWGLFILVGACWLPVVVIQARLTREAERAASVAALPEHFHHWFRWWFALGIPAFTAVVLIYYLMVAKPLAAV